MCFADQNAKLPILAFKRWPIGSPVRVETFR